MYLIKSVSLVDEYVIKRQKQNLNRNYRTDSNHINFDF